ncbi:MAG: hypothetical protein KAW12_21780 [Candidatus Aminicenantes bacterium]|nr:hypothetical protein [Candidatus Aminicenantes bacterium]
MFTRSLCLRFVTILLIVGGLMLFQFQAEAQKAKLKVAKKKYVPIVSGAKEGALAKIKVSASSFKAAAKEGRIPLEVTPSGFWQSKKSLAQKNYDFFEFDVKAPVHLAKVGEPSVPVEVIEVDIPANAKLAKVILKKTLLKTIKNVSLTPAQKPLPVGADKFILAKPKVALSQKVYSQKTAYPGKFYEVVTTGFYGDRKVVILKLFPMQYYPAAKKAEFYKLTGAIKFKATKVTKARTKRELLTKTQKAAGLKVRNLADAGQWEGYKRTVTKKLTANAKKLHTQEMLKALPTVIPCVVICADLFYYPGRDLAAHHTAKGYRSIAVRNSSIQRYISGRDSADKIRNYLRYLYRNYRTRWIILFGDVCTTRCCSLTSVPTRFVKDPAPYGSVDDGKIPCDFYFSCLDGTWDANNNRVYGEIVDRPDLLPEMYVGRLPVNNLDDAMRVVSAIRKYENSPPTKKGALLAANDLGWGGHEVTFKDRTYLPLIRQCRYPTVHRQYQRLGTLSLTSFANVVNRGIDFIQYYGHGSPSGTQLMSMSQVNTKINYTRSFPVQFALSCSTSRYDNRECYGEAWFEKRKVSAYIGSTRVAYGSLSTGEGLDIRFIKYFCPTRRTGISLDYAKYNLFSAYGWNAYTIKTIYEFTLFGDPLMLHVR